MPLPRPGAPQPALGEGEGSPGHPGVRGLACPVGGEGRSSERVLDAWMWALCTQHPQMPVIAALTPSWGLMPAVPSPLGTPLAGLLSARRQRPVAGPGCGKSGSLPLPPFAERGRRGSSEVQGSTAGSMAMPDDFWGSLKRRKWKEAVLKTKRDDREEVQEGPQPPVRRLAKSGTWSPGGGRKDRAVISGAPLCSPAEMGGSLRPECTPGLGHRGAVDRSQGGHGVRSPGLGWPHTMQCTQYVSDKQRTAIWV